MTGDKIKELNTMQNDFNLNDVVETENNEKNILSSKLFSSQHDHLSDTITRIRNGMMRKLEEIVVVKTKLIKSILEELKESGYIRDYEEALSKNNKICYLVYLRPGAIKEIKVISTPSFPRYIKCKDIPSYSKEFCYYGYGTLLISTPQGIMAGHNARKKNLGGKLILRVF